MPCVYCSFGYVLVSGKEYHLRLGDSSDSSDNLLECVRPLVDIRNIVRLVHQPKDDFRLARVSDRMSVMKDAENKPGFCTW